MQRAWTDLYQWVRPWRRYRRSLAKRGHLPPSLARVSAVDGQLTDGEASLLYDLAKAAAGGCIVEIGTFHGKSTVALALGTQAGARLPVYGVDPFLPFEGANGGKFGPADKTILLQNLLLAGVAEHVWLLHTRSADAARGWSRPIALMWIDGDHTYEQVRADVDAWLPFLVPGGIAAFHDSLSLKLGVHRVIAQLFDAGQSFELVSVVDQITVLRKVVDVSQAEGIPLTR